MPTRITKRSLLFLLMLAPALMAGGKKEAPASMSFHVETEASDNPKMIFPQAVSGQTRYFRRLPEISTKDVVGFSPFPSDDGQSYGMLFKLKAGATNRLAAISAVNQGKWLVAQVNGRIVDGVVFDKQITDGVIVIWKGVTLEEIQLFEKAKMRRLDQPEKPKK